MVTCTTAIFFGTINFQPEDHEVVFFAAGPGQVLYIPGTKKNSFSYLTTTFIYVTYTRLLLTS